MLSPPLPREREICTKGPPRERPSVHEHDQVVRGAGLRFWVVVGYGWLESLPVPRQTE